MDHYAVAIVDIADPILKTYEKNFLQLARRY